jgi:hypothetical protein
MIIFTYPCCASLHPVPLSQSYVNGHIKRISTLVQQLAVPLKDTPSFQSQASNFSTFSSLQGVAISQSSVDRVVHQEDSLLWCRVLVVVENLFSLSPLSPNTRTFFLNIFCLTVVSLSILLNIAFSRELSPCRITNSAMTWGFVDIMRALTMSSLFALFSLSDLWHSQHSLLRHSIVSFSGRPLS